MGLAKPLFSPFRLKRFRWAQTDGPPTMWHALKITNKATGEGWHRAASHDDQHS